MNIVESYYDQTTQDEWQRLDRHRTEFAVTTMALSEFLPPSPAAILDIGSGPGRYALMLAQQAYQVTLVDLSHNNLAMAQTKAQEQGVQFVDTIHGNALHLPFLPDASYEAILLLGPLYHLLTEWEQRQAIRESWRLLKPNGRLFVAFITRFAFIRDVARRNPEWLQQNKAYADHLLNTGVHNSTHRFTHAYFAHPDEIIPFMASEGVQTIRLMGCEGIVSGHEEKINEVQGEAWETWVEFNYRLSQEPTLYGASDHLLYIGQKPPA